MTTHVNDDDSMDANAQALDALLRRGDAMQTPAVRVDLESRIVTAAEFALASRRRTARGLRATETSTTDTLAAWFRLALPIAAAAAIVAVLTLSRLDATVASSDSDLSDNDSAALFSALESDGGASLSYHVIASDAATTGVIATEPR
jgi:hypothetical protein